MITYYIHYIVIIFIYNLGEYGLEVYANEPSEGDTYTHMCQYLIHYEYPSNWSNNCIPRLTTAGADAGPSPVAHQFWHSNERTNNNTRNGNLPKYLSATFNEPSLNSSGSLREMYNYELDAPPIGNLPKLYAHSQYENANQVIKEIPIIYITLNSTE